MSWKSTVEPIISKIPSITGPNKTVSFRKKVIWTGGILLLYFFLTNVAILGLAEGSTDAFGGFRGILAGEHGSILQLGIGPIVFGSIALQLITGAGLLKIDRSDPRDQSLYQGLQKIFIVVIVLAQAFPLVFVFGVLEPDPALAAQLGVTTTTIGILMYLQIVIGGILILYMDEVVSKWGIGSGVGLFIVAGVSQRLIGGLVGIPGIIGEQWGVIPTWGRIILGELGLGGTDFRIEFGNFIEFFLLGEGQLLAVFTTVAIIGIVVWAEGVRVEIPIQRQQQKLRGTYPIKLIYASVIPIIIIRVMQAQIQLIGRGIDALLGDSMPAFIGVFQDGRPIDGFFFYISPIQRPEDWMWWMGQATGEVWQILIRIGVDITITVVGAALLSIFWVQTTDMGSDSVAQKIHRSDLQIPGFRSNPSRIERRVDRYIPQITILGGALVGLLAVLANLLGTIGNVQGVGLLLAISITYKLYEQLAQEGLKEKYKFAEKYL